MTTFKPNKNGDIGGTCLQGELSPMLFSELVELFGYPNGSGDRYKVSTEWILESQDGDIVTLYDYKTTELYDSYLPSVAEFRREPYSWHIGAHFQDGAETVSKLIEYITNSNAELKGT